MRIRNIFRKEVKKIFYGQNNNQNSVNEVIYGCDHVQHKWLSELPWKMQTVVNQGLRAPDTHYCKGLKLVCRWMRGVVLQNADTNHTFMCSKKEMPKIEDIENELNYCSVHFATHFLYALEIIGYHHPNCKEKAIAQRYYRGIVEEQWHFNVETEKELEVRLADVNRPKEVHKCPINEADDPYVNYPYG